MSKLSISITLSVVRMQHNGKLLARIPRPSFTNLFSLGLKSVPLIGFDSEPLFQVSHQSGMWSTFAATTSTDPEWLLLKPQGGDSDNAWDRAHEQLAKLRLSGHLAEGAAAYFEPDILRTQQGSPTTPVKASKGFLETWPPHQAVSPGWHLQPGFADFVTAHKTATGKGIRIAHLDTGYSPQHISTPRNIKPELGRNFYEDDHNTVDPGLSAWLDMPGHGTATIALLAGNRVNLEHNGQVYSGDFGGAPDADVVPVRISPSIVHFYTSAMARGLDYALAPNNDSLNRCDVITLSHGGLPSAVWADAVNRLYQARVVVDN